MLYLNERMTEEIGEVQLLKKAKKKKKIELQAASTENQKRLERKQKLRQKLERYQQETTGQEPTILNLHFDDPVDIAEEYQLADIVKNEIVNDLIQRFEKGEITNFDDIEDPLILLGIEEKFINIMSQQNKENTAKIEEIADFFDSFP
jgi:hypothetical protein